jgi:hypothetical protein
LAAGFLDNFSEQIVGVAGEAGASRNQCNDRFGEVRIETGEGVAEIPAPVAHGESQGWWLGQITMLSAAQKTQVMRMLAEIIAPVPG